MEWYGPALVKMRQRNGVDLGERFGGGEREGERDILVFG
jgi:hypothetical protein